MVRGLLLAVVAVVLVIAPLANGQAKPAAVCQAKVNGTCEKNAPKTALCPDGCQRVSGAGPRRGGAVSLTCHVNGVCYGAPRQLGYPCIEGARGARCAAGLRCHPITARCVSPLGEEGALCDDVLPCVPGLSCDVTVRRCVKPSAVNGDCHPYGRPCQAGLSCDPQRAQCFDRPRKAGQPCGRAYPEDACAPGLQCALGACAAVPKLGEVCHDAIPCGPGLGCHPWVNRCYNVPRQVNQPCSPRHACVADLVCDGSTMVCAAAGKAGQPCHDLRPCALGFSCHQGVQRCFDAPRGLGQPCVSPGGLLTACAAGLACDNSTTLCIRAGAAVNEPCWLGRPCAEGLVCSPTTRKCLAATGGMGAVCGAAGDPACDATTTCNPALRRCGKPSARGGPCFTLGDGGQLSCAAGFFCSAGLQQCFAYPADKGDPCVAGGDAPWPCKEGGACTAEYPYCA